MIACIVVFVRERKTLFEFIIMFNITEHDFSFSVDSRIATLDIVDWMRKHTINTMNKNGNDNAIVSK